MVVKAALVALILLLGIGSNSKKPHKPTAHKVPAVSAQAAEPVAPVAPRPIASAIEDTVTRLWTDDTKRIWVRLKHDAWLWGDRDMDAANSIRLPAETIVEIVGAVAGSGFFKASVDGKTGLLAQVNVPKSAASDTIQAKAQADEVKRLATEGRRARAQEQAQKDAAIKREEVRLENFRRSMIARYGEVIGGKVYAGKPWIGMTLEMAEDALGEPARKTTTITADVTRERWLYGDEFLEFEEGKLAKIELSH